MKAKPEGTSYTNIKTLEKRGKRRYNIPVIGHFADRSIRFNSIIQAEAVTGISYNLIFEACIGKIHKARNVYWEFENGRFYIKYKAHYIRMAHLIEEQNEEHHSKPEKKKKKKKKGSEESADEVLEALKASK